MMNESVQYGRTQVVMPDFEELTKLTQDCSKGQLREQGITKIRETHSRQDKRDAVLRNRILQGPLSRRWWRHMNVNETYRAPSLFTWRC